MYNRWKHRKAACICMYRAQRLGIGPAFLSLLQLQGAEQTRWVFWQRLWVKGEHKRGVFFSSRRKKGILCRGR